jgi:hypothetical protein
MEGTPTMITIRDDKLEMRFPEAHAHAEFSCHFQRTLRIPDNDEVHFLPPGLGNFPLRNIERYGDRVPDAWRARGGVMLPMFQSEALWISFGWGANYPCLVKVAAGGINAVTGETWSDAVTPDPQNYLVTPGQPWLDGFCVARGEIRQFVAMPLGKGYTAEEQITGRADLGGLQIVVYPMKGEVWEERLRERESESPVSASCGMILSEPLCLDRPMGLGAGGRMRQQINEDDEDFDVWDLEHPRGCFVHIANSLAWQAITGEAPPTMPPTAERYASAGLPWFDWYDDEAAALEGSDVLAGLKTVKTMGEKRREMAIPENAPVGTVKLVPLAPGQVRWFGA